MKVYKYNKIILRHWDNEGEDIYQCVNGDVYPNKIDICLFTDTATAAQFNVRKEKGVSRYKPNEFFALIKDKLE